MLFPSGINKIILSYCELPFLQELNNSIYRIKSILNVHSFSTNDQKSRWRNNKLCGKTIKNNFNVWYLCKNETWSRYCMTCITKKGNDSLYKYRVKKLTDIRKEMNKKYTKEMIKLKTHLRYINEGRFTIHL